ncbi:hypothetical protein A3SI_16375 [Nitritalea halalkaliphila LW7]|uniref:DUF1232 domain-containing protein n=1 Tax=Nitritalea halalkaliphila LW7 TaxID=1189621 RepID=I5BXK6_9BACT|nr:DUF1232 domain-containing protein [Nitritalea halalkaliphila]EIM74308.1 hypothetical protein A3SI_16375 [Nitritalea halalkaliphila LW7]
MWKQNNYFQQARLRFLAQAEQIASSKEAILKLLEEARAKIAALGESKELQKVLQPLHVFKRMLEAHRSGAHRLSFKTLALLCLGLLYFVTPIDIIPDVIPVLGFADDASVLLAIFHALKQEIEDFQSWEASKENT